MARRKANQEIHMRGWMGPPRTGRTAIAVCHSEKDDYQPRTTATSHAKVTCVRCRAKLGLAS